MAFGGSSIYKGSDQIHDYSCSKCEEDDDLNTEARHFCPQCENYLCDRCVRMHGVFFKKHTVYGRGDIQKWAMVSLDKCDQHGDKLNVHCDDHQELCCSVCVALNHRLCSSISHLPDLAKGFLKTAEFKQLPAAVDNLRRRLDELKNARMKDQTSLKDSYKYTIAKIKALRKEINKILDQFEKNTVEQLDSLMKDLEHSVKDDLDTCAHMDDQWKTLMEKLQQITGKNKETDSYTGFRKCQTKLNETTRLMQEIQRRPKYGIRFKSDESVLRYLRNLNSLGSVDNTYEAKAQNQYSVKIKQDQTKCHIADICELPGGEVVILDIHNQTMKLLNQQYKVIDTYHEQCQIPQDMCYIGNNMVAVASFHNIYIDVPEIHFVEVTKGRLCEGRQFTMKGKCFSIAHNQGHLYMCSNKCIHQYTMDGRMTKRIYEEDHSGGLIVFKCAVSPDGERIYVIDKLEHKLITLDKDGRLLYTFEDPELQEPTGICDSLGGHVFVCCKGSNTVLQVDREGRHILATVVKGSDSLVEPESVWFSAQTSSHIVANCNNDSIIVFRL